MEQLPLEIENIILDYRNQLEFFEKIKPVNNELIKVVSIRNKYIKYITTKYDNNILEINNNEPHILNDIFTLSRIEYLEPAIQEDLNIFKDFRYKWLIKNYVCHGGYYVQQNFFVYERNGKWAKNSLFYTFNFD